ncbi:MAG: class I SAM-dependent methyltransferase [Saprospiraceae bacterium]|nr:class I SAM-dependent methyltransferase [Saprospiraceae bacterium]
MTVTYDKYYQTENLFGEPYPELIEFLAEYPLKGKVLDLGCGQGRDAIALARLGYSVMGIDNSKVGIDQMNQISKAKDLNLVGRVGDIYSFDNFEEFDIILLDSMFHFAKKEREKEIGLVKRILSKIKNGCLVVVCIQDTGNKVQILNQAIDFEKPLNRLADKKFQYTFEDEESGHRSDTDYRMIVIEKKH